MLICYKCNLHLDHVIYEIKRIEISSVSRVVTGACCGDIVRMTFFLEFPSTALCSRILPFHPFLVDL